MRPSCLAAGFFASLTSGAIIPRQGGDDPSCPTVFDFQAQSEPHGILSHIGFLLRSRELGTTNSCSAAPSGGGSIGSVESALCSGDSRFIWSFTNRHGVASIGASLEYRIYFSVEEPMAYEYGNYDIPSDQLVTRYATEGDPNSIYEVYIGPANITLPPVEVA